MQALSAKDADYNFGRVIDMARVALITIEKYGQAVVLVVAFEEYERLKAIESERSAESLRSSENQ